VELGCSRPVVAARGQGRLWGKAMTRSRTCGLVLQVRDEGEWRRDRARTRAEVRAQRVRNGSASGGACDGRTRPWRGHGAAGRRRVQGQKAGQRPGPGTGGTWRSCTPGKAKEKHGLFARTCACALYAWCGVCACPRRHGVAVATARRWWRQCRAGACTGSGRVAEHGEAGCAVGLTAASRVRTGSGIPCPWRRRRGIGEAFVRVREWNASVPGPPQHGEGQSRAGLSRRSWNKMVVQQALHRSRARCAWAWTGSCPQGVR
jgi:hypothetical protein